MTRNVQHVFRLWLATIEHLRPQTVSRPYLFYEPLGRWSSAHHHRAELPHFDRVHILYDVRDLQRAICAFSIVEEEHHLKGEWAGREGEVEVSLPR